MRFAPQTLRDDITHTLSLINDQIDEVERLAEDMNISSVQVRDETGNWTLGPLLVAKIQALHALTLLNKE